MTDALSATFSALADPTRRAILARLAEGSCTVKELSEPFSISAPAITKHLRVLESAGLITRGRDAQTRPCTLEAAPLEEVALFVGRYRQFWEGTLDRLGDYLRDVQAAKRPHHLSKPKPRAKRGSKRSLS
jgi:DNA-binding transcriptional ArsR family regulator